MDTVCRVYECVSVCVAQGVTPRIYMWCNVRGGNVKMSTVYLVLGYAHCNTAVFQSTQPTVKWTCSVVSSWEAAAEQDKQVSHTEENNSL